MLDPIGLKPVLTGDRKVTAVSRVAAPVRADGVTTQDQVASTTVAVAKELAAEPPVDAERVARIRKAIAEGSFPIYPATVADRLIAFKLEWDPSERK